MVLLRKANLQASPLWGSYTVKRRLLQLPKYYRTRRTSIFSTLSLKSRKSIILTKAVLASLILLIGGTLVGLPLRTAGQGATSSPVYVEALDWLNVRYGPDTHTPRIGTIEKGTRY